MSGEGRIRANGGKEVGKVKLEQEVGKLGPG